MCELLGFNFKKVINPNFSFSALQQRSANHKNGWGIAYYPDHCAQVIKEAIAAQQSEIANLISKSKVIKSNIIISHIRKNSRGDQSYSNTHPFERVFKKKHWVFAHNGTVEEMNLAPLNGYYPLGKTDSERAFCYFLGRLKSLQIKGESTSDFQQMELLLKDINRFGKFNVLFSDGKRLFAYHNELTSENQLFFTQRKSPFGLVTLKDDDYSIDLDLEKDIDNEGVIIATSPITSDEEWHPLPKGCLKIYEHGQHVHF